MTVPDVAICLGKISVDPVPQKTADRLFLLGPEAVVGADGVAHGPSILARGCFCNVRPRADGPPDVCGAPVEQIAAHSRTELLALHGVGPKAIAILGEALASKGLGFEGA